MTEHNLLLQEWKGPYGGVPSHQRSEAYDGSEY